MDLPTQVQRTSAASVGLSGTVLATALLAVAGGARGAITTVPTMDPAALMDALNPKGLTVDSVVIRNGVEGQFGTYGNFVEPPVSIRHGVVLSSGDVAALGPLAEAQLPGYDPAGPPFQVNSAMNPLGGGTPEFDAYGDRSHNIEHFDASYDVAALEVHFTLAEPGQVQFDLIFGSVEFPFWTGRYTDAFLVFLDGTDTGDQITFDASGDAVQVGSSFEGLETTGDVNTAFSAPHGLIHHLTTTSPVLSAGAHVLIFEVGDVNDQILDSAAFIANLRVGTGGEGTEPSDDDPSACPGDLNGDGDVNTSDLVRLLDHFGLPRDSHSDGDIVDDGQVNTADLTALLARYGEHC